MASDGGIFTYGDAAFMGTAVGAGAPAVAIDRDTPGYVQLLADGRLVRFH